MIGTPVIGAGELIVAMVHALEQQGIRSVYLRNYENLPASVGNDVDLLVPPGQRGRAARVLREVARAHQWKYAGYGHFSPLAVYFVHPDSAGTLHVDLFDRLEWHFVEFSDSELILQRRGFNGLVFIPDPRDEIFLNLATRLIYQGRIREKHQTQAATYQDIHGPDAIPEAFSEHLGKRGGRGARQLAGRDWQPNRDDRNNLLHSMLIRHGLCRPWRISTGLLRYASRVVRKLAKPPGRFIVIEGADGVGKSTILQAVRPWCSEWCAGRSTYGFHWKPTRLTDGATDKSQPVDPRGKLPRSPLPSLVYLTYHLLGFWWGWLRRVYPALAGSHAVVGDRYSYDLFLDPRRFRLNLSATWCRFAALMTPRPMVTVALVASPETIRNRKGELTVGEIESYQARWEQLSAGRRDMVTVSADGSPDEVILRVKQAILNAATSDDGID